MLQAQSQHLTLFLSEWQKEGAIPALKVFVSIFQKLEPIKQQLCETLASPRPVKIKFRKMSYICLFNARNPRKCHYSKYFFLYLFAFNFTIFAYKICIRSILSQVVFYICFYYCHEWNFQEYRFNGCRTEKKKNGRWVNYITKSNQRFQYEQCTVLLVHTW